MSDFNTDFPNEQEDSLRPIGRSTMDVSAYAQKFDQILAECGKVIVGQREMLELMLVCIMADGHMLLEGVPGIAKTLSARVLARTIETDFARIQFTPDLMPADIIGTSIYNLKTAEFSFQKGPIFSNVVLIDEINRAPAKTQSALFEVMEEKQISFDGSTYDMAFPFVIIATQNPVEQEGTYRLPEGQLDRFLMKLHMGYPSEKDELGILQRYKNQQGRLDIGIVSAQLNPNMIREIQAVLAKIFVEDQMLQYITQITIATRNHSKVYLGASPRASIAILKTSKVVALMAGRDFIIPDDIQYVAPHVLNHRLIMTPDADMEGISPFAVIKEIIEVVEVPR